MLLAQEIAALKVGQRFEVVGQGADDHVEGRRRCGERGAGRRAESAKITKLCTRERANPADRFERLWRYIGEKFRRSFMAKNGCLSVRKIGNYRVIFGSVKVALLAQVDR